MAAADSGSKQAQYETPELRKLMVRCAKGMGMEAASGDVVVLAKNPADDGKPALFLFHEKGMYVIPNAGDHLKNGNLRIRAIIQNDRDREETLRITGSYSQEDFSDLEMQARVIDPTNLTPEVLQFINDVPASTLATKPWVGERHMLQDILLEAMTQPAVANQMEQKLAELSKRFPMGSLSEDAVYLSRKEDARKLGKTNPKQASEDFATAMLLSLQTSAKKAIGKNLGAMKETLENLKACEELDPKSLTKASRLMTRAVGELAMAAISSSERFGDSYDQVLQGIIGKPDLYPDEKTMDEKAREQAHTLYLGMVNGEREALRKLNHDSQIRQQLSRQHHLEQGGGEGSH